MPRIAALMMSVLLAGATAAIAGDHLLVFGGGYSPGANQLSLESNALYFQRVLAKLGVEKPDLEIYFADGKSPGRDLQVRNVARTFDSLPSLLACLLGPSRDIQFDYRSSRIPGVKGPANRENLDRYIHSARNFTAEDDRLFLYFTGHGGKSESRGTPNTRTFLWADQEMTMKQWVERLDKLPAKLPVVMVMVQCYSGGFANVLFKDGEPDAGLSEHLRAGFFATVPDRQAAGCTAEIDEADYREYSTSFFEALCGESRQGRMIDPPDYDRDGHVSFLEAHAYTCIHAQTIDIPVKTSDAFLRKYSAANAVQGMMTADSPIQKLLAAAAPATRAVIERLSERHELKGENRASETRKLAGVFEGRRKSVDEESRRVTREYNNVKRQIADAVKNRWPELGNPWHPDVGDLLKKEGGEIRKIIQSHPRYAEWIKLGRTSEELDARHGDLVKKWCITQRLLRYVENAALEANLHKVADPPIVARYQQLMELENGRIGP